MAVTANKEQFVLIYTSNKNHDNLVYQVDNVHRGVYHLRCVETSRVIKAHKSRIRKVLSEEEMMNGTGVIEDTEVVNESTTTDNIEVKALEETDETIEAIKPKAKVKKTKAQAIPFDFDQFKTDGYEIWVKSDLEFDIENVKVDAICLIYPDEASYETFNIYNGSLGKKGSRGQNYKFTEKNTIERKRKQLGKKGYTQRSN
tara:strand:- start:82709 stop:83311 length:603 start_codon:yes stop_codon:yes gene_type:complete